MTNYLGVEAAMYCSAVVDMIESSEVQVSIF